MDVFKVSIMECDKDSETGDNFLFVLDLKVSFDFFFIHALICCEKGLEWEIFIVEFQELCLKGAAYDRSRTRLRIYEWCGNV